MYVAIFWFALSLVACMGLVYLAYRIEPHWVSKDGKRFMCGAQPISAAGKVEGRMRETRVIVLPDGALHLSVKRRLRRRASLWKVSGKSQTPPRNRQVYLLYAHGTEPEAGLVALRLPTKSRAVPVLEALLPAGA